MHILVTGGTGFIGEALVPALLQRGDTVTVLTRQAIPDREGVSYCSSLDGFAGADAVINLAGASMAGRRWSDAYKRELLASRIDTTHRLVAAMAKWPRPAQVLLSASAIGYYGHHGDEPLHESSAAVPGFAQDLCQQWEEAARAAEATGVRTCLLRLGVVLAPGGGAFQQMAMPFRFGLGNWVGNGEQWLSWVHRQDVVAAMLYLLDNESASGPYNLTAPEPVTSRGFCRAMGRHFRTLLSLPMPAPVMRLMVGEMADELLLNGQRVLPERLQQAGFRFAFPDLDSALVEITGR